MRWPAAACLVCLVLAPPPAGAARVRLGPHHGAIVRQALEDAARRLQDPACAAVLDDFADFEGSLRAPLEAAGVSPASYLGWLVFVDGFGHPACRAPGVMAATSPGSRVVYVCPARFQALRATAPVRAEAVLIHEMLHSLGLGEDPPTSAEITARVLRRCAPEGR